MRTKTLGRLAVLGTMLCVGACQTTPLVAGIDCSALLGPTLRTGVESAPFPTENTVGEWVSFADQQTGRLIDANGRRAAVVEIIDACEGEQRKLTRKRLFGIL